MIVERLVLYLKHKGIAVSAFEKELGLGNATISKAYKAGGSIGSDKIEKIFLQCRDLSPIWLMTGDGDMIISDDERPLKKLPLLPMEAFAGPGVPVYNDLPIEDYYAVREFKSCDFLIRVTGDSMTPKFTGGDIVACKKVQDVFFVQWGRVYVIYTESQGAMIKRIQPSEREDCIKCVSDNEKYAPFDVPKSDIVSLALVNGSISLE